jgi:hypothetical protein
MAERYSVNTRYWGGSAVPRLNPKCVDTSLNAKLAGPWPEPLVRETSRQNCVQETAGSKRRLDRDNTQLPDRFRK